MRPSTLLGILAGLGLLAGCSGSDNGPNGPDGGPDAGSGGSLMVTVSGTGTSPGDVTVSGPAGFLQHLTATTTLTDLAPGSYAFDAGPVRVAAEVIDWFADPSLPAPVEVQASQSSAAEVSYQRRAGSGLLWAPSVNDGWVNGFDPAALVGFGSSPDASVQLVDYASDGGPNAGAEAAVFDRQGRLWLSSGWASGVPHLDAFTADQLGSSSDAGARIVITSVMTDAGAPSLENTRALAFDPNGNLWVANSGYPSSLVEYTPDLLAASGPTQPAQVWTGAAITFPTGMAFDSQGNLWISQAGGPSNTEGIFEIAAASLSSHDLPAFAVSLVNDGGSPGFTRALAFDSQGTLWATIEGGPADSYLVAIAPADRAASGFLTMTRVLANVSDGGLPAFDCPAYVAFDNAGNAWIANRGHNDANATTCSAAMTTLTEVPASQLGGSGEITPVAAVNVPAVDYGAFALDPAPAKLPIYR